MERYIKHFKTITKHKYYVGIECFKIGLYWQGLVHDLSKYSLTEFFTSARYFQGDSSPIDKEKTEIGYSISWLNHKSKNKHHWHYWTDIEKGKIISIPMSKKYIQEMLCDWIGAGRAYSGASDVESYYLKVKDEIILHPETRKKFECLISNNWAEQHRANDFTGMNYPIKY